MGRSTMDARDLFLSHGSGDAEVARQLRSLLEAEGYSCWMAPDDIVGTDSWTEQILAAIDASRAMLVVISANANASPHVSREVNLALARGRAVLPVRIDSTPPDGALEHLFSLVQRVDAFPPPIINHADRITARLDALLRADATPPPKALPPAPRTKAAEEIEAETEPARRTMLRRTASATPRSTGSIGPGSVVGDFTLETLLGEGGIGRVYRARQFEPNRAVALKVIRPDRANDDAYRRLFLAEKDTLSTLEHPSIVPIYAAGDENGVLYTAMRLIDGSDLQDRINAQGQLSLPETVRILRPIADAIDHAHAVGVIHRDLKPSNILLDRQGRPYLTDFGLGTAVERQGQVSTSHLALGTLDYMAPEQVMGGSDPALANRIDVYALGCVVHACLTGRPPFVRETPEQLMYAHTHEDPPPLRAVRPELPVAVDDAVARSLANNPMDRFATATDLVGAIEAASASATTGLARALEIPAASPGVRGSQSMERTALPSGSRRSGDGLVGRLWRRWGRREAPAPAHSDSLGQTGSRPATGLIQRAEPLGSVRERSAMDERRQGDQVECTVHAPPGALPGSQFLVQAWIHLLNQADEVGRLAHELDATARLRAFRTLELRIERDTRVMIELRLPGGIVDDPWQSLVWTGRPQAATFGVRLPDDATSPATLIGTVSLFLEDVPMGHLKFAVAVGTQTAPNDTLKAAARVATRYEHAFVSYASADRAKVLPRIQMLQALGIRFFQDILSLDPGERWEPELFRQIDRCDLFLLFWSENARTSDWVRREVSHAMSRKAGDDAQPPEVRPVIIEGPPVPPPWDELRHLHFNDRVLFLQDR